MDAEVPCAWLESSEPSYILYTSGTTGKPKGVQRDTGGHAVALAASMKLIFCGNPGETYFATSDIGWVVGHSYIIYGPLIAGMATIMYEGTPIRPDGGIWWKHRREVQGDDDVLGADRDPRAEEAGPGVPEEVRPVVAAAAVPGRRAARRDRPHAGSADGIGKPIIDNFWQTETGWPILAIPRGVEALPSKFGSPGVPAYGYNVKLYDEATGEEITGHHVKGVVAIEGPLAARMHVNRMGRRRPLREDLLDHDSQPAGLFDVRLGHP